MLTVLGSSNMYVGHGLVSFADIGVNSHCFLATQIYRGGLEYTPEIFWYPPICMGVQCLFWMFLGVPEYVGGS